jgi:hypothetical protein
MAQVKLRNTKAVRLDEDAKGRVTFFGADVGFPQRDLADSVEPESSILTSLPDGFVFGP